MAVTKLADMIVPEVFIPYVIRRTAEKSNLVQSGIIASNPVLDQLITGGGATIQMPVFNDLSGDDQVLGETAMTVNGITTAKDVAAVLYRQNAWGATELAGCMSGTDPMKAIGELVADYWVRREQKILISTLEGAFGAASMAGLVKDITSDASTAISANAVLDAKQLKGDSAGDLVAIAMHSATFTKLQKDNVIAFIPAAESKVQIPTYLGYRVIVDDGLPVTPATTGDNPTPAKYTTYLFAAGTVGRGEGTPAALTPVETDRDSLASTDILINRRALVLHPQGLKWKGTPTAATPNNTELATGTNWERVADVKKMGIVKLIHTL